MLRNSEAVTALAGATGPPTQRMFGATLPVFVTLTVTIAATVPVLEMVTVLPASMLGCADDGRRP